jgi:hypothetical protein
MLEQAPPAAGAGVALVYWRAICGVVVLLCLRLLCLSRSQDLSSHQLLWLGLTTPLAMETSHEEHQGPIRAHSTVSTQQPT